MDSHLAHGAMLENPVAEVVTSLVHQVLMTLIPDQIPHHPIVMAECTQGNLQCSKTGGSTEDNAESIKGSYLQGNVIFNISMAVVNGTILTFALVTLISLIALVGTTFSFLGGMGLYNSFIKKTG